MGRALRVSLTAPQFVSSPGPLLEAAEAVDRLGLSGLFLFDHLVAIGDHLRPILELTSVLGGIAPRIESRIGTLVMRAPLRGPEVTAAVASTAARLAPGRFVLGLGAGDALSAEEAARFGQDRLGRDERVRLVARTIELVRAQRPEVPIWVGGRHPRLLELAAECADGWNGWGLEAAETAEIGAALIAANPSIEVTWGGAVLIGRDGDEVERLVRERGGAGGVLPGDPAQVAAALTPFVEAGAAELVVSVLPNRKERWELFAREVLPRLPGTRL